MMAILSRMQHTDEIGIHCIVSLGLISAYLQIALEDTSMPVSYLVLDVDRTFNCELPFNRSHLAKGMFCMFGGAASRDTNFTSHNDEDHSDRASYQVPFRSYL